MRRIIRAFSSAIEADFLSRFGIIYEKIAGVLNRYGVAAWASIWLGIIGSSDIK